MLRMSSLVIPLLKFKYTGGLSNIAITLGGVWNGVEPRTDIKHWENNPDIVGSVSTEPRRVSHNIWHRLALKEGECLKPPSDPSASQGCNDDNDCDDNNKCTVDFCNESNLCAISETFEYCCGNGKCEAGETHHCASDCGPFPIRPTEFCKGGCHTLDGFMIDVGVSEKAERKIFISSINLAYSPPQNNGGATIDVYVTTEGSYAGKEQSSINWEWISTVQVFRYNPKRHSDVVEIDLVHSIPVDIGNKRGFYFHASENIIKFGEGVYSLRNDHEVELYSSRAVTGIFGDGIDGFTLSCEVNYLLDDSPPSLTQSELQSLSNLFSSGMTSRTPAASAAPRSSPPPLPNLHSEGDSIQNTTTGEQQMIEDDVEYHSEESFSSSDETQLDSDAPALPSGETQLDSQVASSSGPTHRLMNYISCLTLILASVYG